MARIKHITLAANDDTVVNLDDDVRRVEILNRNGAGEVYYKVDPPQGFTIAVKQDDVDVLPACINAEIKPSRASGSTKVLLISDVAVEVTVRDADNDV